MFQFDGLLVCAINATLTDCPGRWRRREVFGIDRDYAVVEHAVIE